MVLLTVLTVVVCCIRFVFDGVTVPIGEKALSVGHTDPLAYGSILSPVLAAHGFVKISAANIAAKITNKTSVDVSNER